MTLDDAIWRLYRDLYQAEGYEQQHQLTPPPGTREYARHLDVLAYDAAKRDPGASQAFKQAIDLAVDWLKSALPRSEPSPLSAPVIDLIPNVGVLIESIVEPFFAPEFVDFRLFSQLRARIAANTERINRVRPTKLRADTRDLVRTYLRATPLESLFFAEVPLPFPQERRYEGHWILARQGAGKTQALSYLIEQDLAQVARGHASIVLLDSQGNTPGQGDKPPTLLYTLSHLKLFAPDQPLAGKLVYIDPTDDPPIPFNIFDLGFSGGAEARFAAAKKLLDFVFTALVGEPFSPPMEMLFSNTLRLMLSMPGAQLADLRRVLLPDGAKRYAAEIARLDDESRDFFQHQFNSRNIDVTKTAVLNRLSGLRNVPAFQRLVSHRKTEFSLFDELEAGKVIVIDTNAAELQDGTSVIGRFFLALIAAVARMRIRVDERRKTPVFVYIDELADYCANHANQFAEIIATCRKQNIAICAANQRLSQIADTDVQGALLSTAIKFANPFERDARAIAPNMGATPPDFLINRPSGSFAAHIVGMPRAVSINIPFPNLSVLPRMSPAEYRQLRDDIRRRYAATAPEPSPEDEPASEPGEPEPRGSSTKAGNRPNDPEDFHSGGDAWER